MSSLLQQLESNEAVLLMYLADELPAEDRAEVEQMLAMDRSLAAELDRLRELDHSAAAILARLDELSPPVRSESLARRVGRALRPRQLEYASIVRGPADRPRGLRYPWWTYPLASAAAILLAFLAWWGNQPGPAGPLYLPPVADQPRMMPMYFPPRDDQAIARAFAGADSAVEIWPLLSRPELEEMEDHLAALTDESEDVSTMLTLFAMEYQ